jgi:hypothetical protein
MPSRMPPVAAQMATAIQDVSRGIHGLRRKVSTAAPNTSTLKPMPLPICHFQSGKLLMASLGGYFKARCTESSKPQYPPTVPSSWRFQGWS